MSDLSERLRRIPFCDLGVRHRRAIDLSARNDAAAAGQVLRTRGNFDDKTLG